MEKEATNPDSLVLAGSWRWRRPDLPFWPSGAGTWRWQTGNHRQPDAAGRARLDVVNRSGQVRIRWCLYPAPAPADSVLLVPEHPTVWHSIRTAGLQPGASPPLPLPRLDVESGEYLDLLDFLQALTEPFFDSTVTHWPDTPIPVSLVPAVSGEVDLAACLVEAAGAWNAGIASPLFEVRDDAAWGVRLIHFAGVDLSPPLRARITRLDGHGRPLVVQIIVGDTYSEQRERIYAVRGMVHELGHALFLWGHSRDREHVLWGAAPPQRNDPSPDERKAVQLWHGLPDGLDLSLYGRLAAAAGQRTSTQ